jgi:hypothetical protein
MSAPPTCPLPGCSKPTDQVGTPCGECIQAFGPYLAEAPPRDVPVTAEQITAELHARDRGIAAAYTLQAVTEIATTAADLPTYEAAVRLLANRVSGPQIGERKANQRCWTCEERRTCTLEPLGWACDMCRQIS